MDKAPPWNLDHPHIAAVIDGEHVLWSGSPQVVWTRELLRAAVRWLKSCYWTFGAALVVALPIYFPGLRNGGLIFVSIIAGIILIGQARHYLVTPVKAYLRLKRTTYTLTNWRTIIAVREGSRVMEARAPSIVEVASLIATSSRAPAVLSTRLRPTRLKSS